MSRPCTENCATTSQVDDEASTSTWRLPILQVRTRREGRLRLACAVFVNVALLLTGVACFVWEMVVFNTVDRDWRDMLFDHRITHAARAIDHAYFNQTLPGLATLAALQYRGRNFTAQAAMVSATGVPVLELRCGAMPTAACAAIRSIANAALGLEPRNCRKVGKVIWMPNRQTASTTELPSLVLWESGQELLTPRFTAAAANDTGVAPEVITQWINDVLERHGNPRFVAPAQDTFFPLLDGNAQFWQQQSSFGKNRKKFGWSDDINPWKVPCPDTSWNATSYISDASIVFPRFVVGEPQDLEVSYGGRSSFVAKFSADVTGNGTLRVGRLSSVNIYIAKVVPLGCEAWKISKIDALYDSLGEASMRDAPGALWGTTSVQNVRAQFFDLAQPHQLHLPVYSGQIFTVLALALGCAMVIGFVLLAPGYFIAVWNAAVYQGKPPPFAPFGTKYRGW